MKNDRSSRRKERCLDTAENGLSEGESWMSLRMKRRPNWTACRLAVEAPARDAAGASRKAPPEAPRSRVTPARDAELASALASARETLALKPKGAGAKKVLTCKSGL